MITVPETGHRTRLIGQLHSYCGGIAQLGERLNGIQEVSGSIPLTSTKKDEPQGQNDLVVFLYSDRSLSHSGLGRSSV